MTDEEKAEEILQTKGSMTFCAKGCGYTEKVKELIAIGLAEGRKEGYAQGEQMLMASGEIVKKGFLDNLEKENVQLSNSVTELTNTKTELENKVTELEKQIQRMKNFYNCSHSSRALCPNGHKCNGCKDWEFTE